MRIIIFVVVLMLAGCANPKFDSGKTFYDSGNYPAARDRFMDCVTTTGDRACMTFLGVVYLKMGDRESAIRWYTLAARYGEPTAIANLAGSGLPVPTADLAAQKSSSDDSYFLMGVLQGMNGASQSRNNSNTDNSSKTITCQPGYIPGQVTCNSR